MEHIDLWLLIVIPVLQIFFFVIKGVTGFGDALVSGPVLSMMLDNGTISPMSLLLSVPANVVVSVQNRKAFKLRETLPTVLCIMAGAIPGTFLLKYASSWVLKAALGVLVIGIGIEMLTRNRAKPAKANPVIRALVSFCSGVTSGLYGINLFFVAYAERTATSKENFRGSICFVFLIENIFRFFLYLATGVLTGKAFLLAALSVPGMLLGLWLGGKLDKKMSEKTARLTVIVLFFIGGVSILVKALVWRA